MHTTRMLICFDGKYIFQGNRVHGTCKKDHINKFQLLIDEGSCYRIGNFGVGENGGNYPLLSHRYKLNLYKNSSVTRLAVPTTMFVDSNLSRS